MPYIYKIINDINGKIYIGKTSLNSIEQRFKEHISDSHKTHIEKRPLYEAFNKYGIEHFSIEEIEQVENDIQACERETYWIEKLRTYIGFDDCNGYNATLGGDGKRYYDYSLLAQEYLNLGTLKAVINKYGCDEKTARLACKENNIEIKIAPNQRAIKRINEKTNEIIEYSSVMDAAREFTNKPLETARKNISRALNKNGNAYGYKWEYIN